MRLVYSLAIALVLPSVSRAQAPVRQFQFEQYPANVYHGTLRTPTGLKQDKDGIWYDEGGRLIIAPKITFAGQYYLSAHTCGTGCRYYQLSNLRTGVDISAVSMFNANEPFPKTRDGHPYLTVLHYKSDSRLLIAEYHLDFDDPDKHETCRQRYFVLEDGTLKSISKTFSFCTEGQEP